MRNTNNKVGGSLEPDTEIVDLSSLDRKVIEPSDPGKKFSKPSNPNRKVVEPSNADRGDIAASESQDREGILPQRVLIER